MTQNILCHFLLLSVLYLELCVSSLHPFVVKTSPIFDAMGHTSVFPLLKMVELRVSSLHPFVVKMR